VNFWEQPAPGFAWNLDAWHLFGCVNVHEALAWAHGQARGRRFELFVAPYGYEVAEADVATLIRLLGDNPNLP
jgi:hypothetical protein